MALRSFIFLSLTLHVSYVLFICRSNSAFVNNTNLKNCERLILYSFCGFILGMLFGMFLLIIRSYIEQRYLRKIIHFYKYNLLQTPQNMYIDGMSAIDSDIELHQNGAAATGTGTAAGIVSNETTNYHDCIPEIITTV